MLVSRIQASHKGYFGTLLLPFTERGLRPGSDVRDTISAALASLRVSALGQPIHRPDDPLPRRRVISISSQFEQVDENGVYRSACR